MSAPSILIGLAIYELLVKTFHGFSGFAGSVALALLAAPVVTRTTEDVLKLQPPALREAGVALGSPLASTIRRILWRSARTGILTGGLLAFARISGETAPLLFTALNNQGFNLNMTKPMANLPGVIFPGRSQRLRRSAEPRLGRRPADRRRRAVRQHHRPHARPGEPSVMNVQATAETYESYIERLPEGSAKLDIRNLNFYYGKSKALHGVSTGFGEKQITALIGPSGCGKSTLLRTPSTVIYALYPGQRAEGEIIFDVATTSWRPSRGPVGPACSDRHGVPEADPIPDVDLRQRGLRRAPFTKTSAVRIPPTPASRNPCT